MNVSLIAKAFLDGSFSSIGIFLTYQVKDVRRRITWSVAMGFMLFLLDFTSLTGGYLRLPPAHIAIYGLVMGMLIGFFYKWFDTAGRRTTK